MNEEEIRAAASSAVNRIGEEREEFIRGNYPKEDFDRIVKMCNWLDDVANDSVEARAFEPCIYNMGCGREY